MRLLCSRREIRKLQHLSTYLYKKSALKIPQISISIDDEPLTSLLFTTEIEGMLHDAKFHFDSKSGELTFHCITSGSVDNKEPIVITSFEPSQIEQKLEEYFCLDKVYGTRTSDEIAFVDLEDASGVPSFEGEILVYRKNSAAELKKYGAGVNLYINEFALYNYLSESNDWLDLADFSQRKKATNLKPHNVFGYINIPRFVESKEKLKISKERADLITDVVYTKFMYIVKAVILRIILILTYQ